MIVLKTFASSMKTNEMYGFNFFSETANIAALKRTTQVSKTKEPDTKSPFVKIIANGIICSHAFASPLASSVRMTIKNIVF